MKRVSGIDPARRTRARRRALQALYAIELSGNPPRQVLAEFAEERDPDKVDLEYFEELVLGVAREREDLDRILATALDRRWNGSIRSSGRCCESASMSSLAAPSCLSR